MNGLEILKIRVSPIQFDIIDFYPFIIDFYPFINEDLSVFIDSMNYAKNYVEITDEQYQIILACRMTVLKNNDSTWINTGLDNFDVPMGGYDSAHIADLYIINTLSTIVDPIQIGLYQ